MNPQPTSYELNSLSIAYQTFTADSKGEGFSATWTNTFGYPIFIVGVEIWVGEQGGAITDTPFQFVNYTQNVVIVARGWDHYSPPAGINDNTATPFWGPCYYRVMPNDVLQFSVKAISYNGLEFVSAGCMVRYLV